MSKVTRGIVLISVLLLGGLLSACSKGESIKETVPPVRSQVIKLDGLQQAASYPGEVRGRVETQMAFQVGGKIVRRNVDLGSVVSAGDVLMEIDPKDIQQVVNASSAQVASAQSQLSLAKSNVERYRQLYEQNAISRAQLDQYENAYAVAEATVRQSAAQYSQGANQLGYSSLNAPSAGVIAAVNAEAGQVVGAGQAVLTLVQDGEREIEISLPENRVDELRKAEQLRVTFWALPGVSVDGKVREISPIADKVSRTYKARVQLVNPPGEIKLGMTASVTAASAPAARTVFIPLSAVYQTGDTPNVWLINNNVVSLRPVKIGAFGDGKVQVLSGLADGDTIVTAGVHKLREGQTVRVSGDVQ